MTLVWLLAQAENAAETAQSAAATVAELSTVDWPLVVLLLVSLGVCLWMARRLRHGQAPLAYDERRPVPWHGADVAVSFVALYGSMVLAQSVLLRLYDVRPSAGGDIPDEVLPFFLIAQSLCEIGMMVFVIGLLMRRTGANGADLGFTLKHFRRDLAAGVIGLLFITAPISILYAMLEKKELHPLIELVGREPSNLWLIGFCAVLVAPLVEEFFFRVVLQGWLERWEQAGPGGTSLVPSLPPGMLPILISSLLFAVAHGVQWPAPVPLFFLALVLGYLYHQTHRLLPSLIVHALFNGITFLNLWWLVHSGALAGGK